MNRRISRARRRARGGAARERSSRKTPNRAALSLVAVVVLVAFGASMLLDLGGSGSSTPPGIPSDADVVPVDGATLVTVERIIDGDTLVVGALGTQLTVRLFGVDTPERGEACYREATDRLEALAGDRIQLLPDERLQDPFGRELRYAYTVDAVLIDEVLVAEGYGAAWRRDGQFRDRIVEAEEEAQAGRVGCLWSE